MRQLFTALAIFTLGAAVIELGAAAFGHPILFGTPLFFLMHVLVLASAIAAFYFCPRAVFAGAGHILINRLRPYLSHRAYTALCASFLFGLLVALGALVVQPFSDHIPLFFSAFWVAIQSCSATLLLCIRANGQPNI